MKGVMRTFKLSVHNKTNKSQDILLSPKDFPDVKAGDIVELYPAEAEGNHIVLQVRQVGEDLQHKDSVSIEQGIASIFSFRAHKDVVHVKKVDPEDVRLDLVELLFKEQYFGRSDMWRMMKTMMSTCVHLKKNIEFSEMRATVNELWARGENVTSGFVTDDTRICFRSPTAVVQIFIQMSKEMWDFDLYGDLYFEKAVSGFLTELFDRWKEQATLHDVTIVLFSRTFYDAQSIEDFPFSVRECLLVDSMGRIYEDFYRIVVQNERYEEWSCVLRQLRTLFSTYKQTVLHHHEHGGQQQGWKMPKAINSLASQGNVLETLNMSLNLFEKHFMDRNFDRTGKASVVITPGTGVFEVDRQLANITKQRTIDCGIGSDLVCMGEKPLHAAPLFRFLNKSPHKSIEVGDDYNIPHWMNHSFYRSKKMDDNSVSFVPQIEPPLALLKLLEEGPKPVKNRLLPHQDYPDTNIPFVDYDEYDSQVFKLPAGTMPRTFSHRNQGGVHAVAQHQRLAMQERIKEAKLRRKNRPRQISDDVLGYLNNYKEKSRDMSPAISIPSKMTQDDMAPSSFGIYPKPEKTLSHDSLESSESDELISQRAVVGSAGSLIGGHSRHTYDYRPHRALINPFAPSRLQFKITSNRRRWVHAFPVDHQGRVIQARHVHSVPDTEEDSDGLKNGKDKNKGGVMGYIETLTSKRSRTVAGQQHSLDVESADGHTNNGSDLLGGSPVSRFEPYASGTPKKIKPETAGPYTRRMQHARTRMFGSSKSGSDQDWSPDISTAVDWKSLTYPASLPITTDFLPESQLKNEYFVSEYSLIPETLMAEMEISTSWSRMPSLDDKTIQVYRRPPLTTQEVFLELLSQRLGLGFQLVTKKSKSQSGDAASYHQNTSGPIIKSRFSTEIEEYNMSIGRIYHKLSLRGDDEIVVKTYRPMHPLPQLYYEYRYRFQVPDAYSYDVSWTNFSNAKLEEYNWNHLDQYIYTQGESEQGLIESMKYWRSRFLLLPLLHPATKKIIDKDSKRCDIYDAKTPAELNQLIQGFLKFLEIMNKIKRPNTQRKAKTDSSTASASTQGDNGSPEEKLNKASAPMKIIEAMLDPVHELNMICGHPGLPYNTFIAAEAVTWCQNNVQGVETVPEAVELMQKLMDEHLVLHSSGNPNHQFIYGFYLYYIPQRLVLKPGQSAEALSIPTTHLNTPGANYNYLFQNEWCEVTFLPVKPPPKETKADSEESPRKASKRRDHHRPHVEQADYTVLPEVDHWKIRTGKEPEGRGLQPSGYVLNDLYRASVLHKYVNVEVDPNKKSDRKEYAVSRYHAYYSPYCAFEFQIQWMVATGCTLGDLVNTYARRATSCGFHLLPVPCDPFALPYTENSDPLRGPIFVPLEMQALGGNLFEDCTDKRRQEILYSIQDAILKSFGFLPVCVRMPENSARHRTLGRLDESYNHQYVHCTAGMFVLIPESNPGSPPDKLAELSAKTPSPHLVLDSSGLKKKSSADLHKFYIARQGRPEAVPNQVGFLWSWNYMSSRRWRSAHTGDEVFQDTVLADFRKFCSNEENRLESFWLKFHRMNAFEKSESRDNECGDGTEERKLFTRGFEERRPSAHDSVEHPLDRGIEHLLNRGLEHPSANPNVERPSADPNVEHPLVHSGLDHPLA